MHDFLACGDDGLGLLPSKHRLSNLRSVCQMRQTGLIHHDARLCEPLFQLAAKRLRHFFNIASEGDLLFGAAVVGIAARKMPDSRLALSRDVMFVIVDIEY